MFFFTKATSGNGLSPGGLGPSLGSPLLNERDVTSSYLSPVGPPFPPNPQSPRTKDHIIGATELKKLTGAVILMHQDDLSLYQKVKEQCRDFRIPPPLETLAPPDDYLADGDVVQWAQDLTVKCLHCPGHTPGSLSYYFEQQKVVCPGDTLFRGSVGRTNWAGIPSLQGTSDSNQILGSIKTKLLTLDGDVMVVSGHGPETTIALEKKHNPFVR